MMLLSLEKIAFFCMIYITYTFAYHEESNLLEDQVAHEKDKYYKIQNVYDREPPRWKNYMSLIEKAQNDYIPCNNNSCSCFTDQIDFDLKPWLQEGIPKILVDEINEMGIRYKILNNKVYRQKRCDFPARCEGIQYFILKVAKSMNNTEFVVNIRDWPQIIKDTRKYHLNGIPLPLFSFSKDKNWYEDILYPAWAFWSGGPAIKSYPKGIGNWGLLSERIAKSAPSWQDKKSIAFFRGSRTSPERDPLILFSREKPHIIDAQYTKNQAWRSVADTLGKEPASTITFEEQCDNKYLLNLRGAAASFRFKHLFMCKSLVINIESEWMEYFYPQLKPWIHYVPASNEMKELENIILFLRENDGIAREIAKNGYEFVWSQLTMESVLCYWDTLLKSYQKLLRYEPIYDKDFIEIK